MTALEEQLLRDNLQVMNGGCLGIRDGRHVVHPRVGDHPISIAPLAQAVEKGYAVVQGDRNHTICLTPAGWAFCGAL